MAVPSTGTDPVTETTPVASTTAPLGPLNSSLHTSVRPEAGGGDGGPPSGRGAPQPWPSRAPIPRTTSAGAARGVRRRHAQ